MFEAFMGCIERAIDLKKYYNEPINVIEINTNTYNLLIEDGYKIEDGIIDWLEIMLNDTLDDFKFNLL